MPKLKLKTEKLRSQRLTNLYAKSKLNQAELARKEGVSRAAINQRLKRTPVQKTLQQQIEKYAKKTGITLQWLLRKYKIGADDAKKIIGYLHQYKKDEEGKIDKAEPDEAVSNEFITVDDFAVQRLYLRDIAEIMKWIKSNGLHIDQSKHTHYVIFRNPRAAREESSEAPELPTR